MSRLDPDKVYTRADLTRTKEGPCGFAVQVCGLCDGRSLAGDDLIDHDMSCPFGNSFVLAIQGVALTAPREDICGQCPAKDRACVVSDWQASTHQTLMKACGRYAVDDGRIDDVDAE